MVYLSWLAPGGIRGRIKHLPGHLCAVTGLCHFLQRLFDVNVNKYHVIPGLTPYHQRRHTPDAVLRIYAGSILHPSVTPSFTSCSTASVVVFMSLLTSPRSVAECRTAGFRIRFSPSGIEKETKYSAPSAGFSRFAAFCWLTRISINWRP